MGNMDTNGTYACNVVIDLEFTPVPRQYWRQGLRHEIIEVADVFRASIVDFGRTSLTIEATGTAEKMAALDDLLRSYGIKEIVRTGKISLSRGSHD